MKNALLYGKVMKYLLDKIKNEYQPGDFLPPQTEIARNTGTSLITVKRAVKELEQQGYVTARAGKGTFVRKPPIIDKHIGVSSWTDSVAGSGRQPSTAWVRMEKKLPSPGIANMLHLKARKHTVRIRRLRMVDDKPACLMQNEIPLDLVPGITGSNIPGESLYGWLLKTYKIAPAWAEEEVYARKASAEEVKSLSLSEPFVLVIERVSYLTDGTPFEVSSIIANAENYRYQSRQINQTLRLEQIHEIIQK